MRDAHDDLLRALKARIEGAEHLEICSAHSEAWSSATFSGSRHNFALALSGPAAAAMTSRLAARLDAIEFDLPGHLVADIAITGRVDGPDRSAFSVEALTVENW
jgi:hypothetical protein